MELDLEEHFSDDRCRELVRGHLGLVELKSNKEARALWRIHRTALAALRWKYARHPNTRLRLGGTN